MWRGSDGCEEWRREYWEGLVRRSMVQTRKCQTVFNCGIFHLQNTFQCTCIRYNLVLFAVFFSLMFWVSHLINQNNANTFCIIGKYILFCKTFKLAPPKRALWSTYQLTLILRRSRTGTVWFYTSTSNKRAARPKLYTKSLTGDLKHMYSRLTLVRISIKL